MSKRKESQRARRVKKDWTKGNRGRLSRLDAIGGKEEDFDALTGGRESMRPRGVTIDELRDVEALPRGEVVRTQSGTYDVALEGSGTIVSCRVKRGASTENPQATIVVIGDVVRVAMMEGNHGLIQHVEERHGIIGRAGTGAHRGGQQVIAANVDMILCVVSAERDNIRPSLIDRFIVGALLGEVEPVIVVNKIDTADEQFIEAIAETLAIYPELGYQVLFTSATTGYGLEDLVAACAGLTCAIIGQSGVGKSTLVNAVLGREEREVGEVRASDRRGRHTTVGSQILDMPGGGRLIDTPGLREFGIWDLDPQELDGYFVEFADYHQKCKYLPCTHTHEPECAVQAAVEAGEIDQGRYESYLAILETLKE